MSPRDLLTGSFEAAIAAVRAESVLPPHLPAPVSGRTIVIGAGKAAADMAACVERHWPSGAALEGLVLTRHGHATPTHQIRVVEAGHPLPDEFGLRAAEAILDLIRLAKPTDQVLALISGGGSSLLSLPVPGLTLGDLRQVAQSLLNSGAPIGEINIVRKHISLTLGGRMAQACRAPVRALLISDIAGDDHSTIASGPFAPDASTYADALAVLNHWKIAVPATVTHYLTRGMRGKEPETPEHDDPCFAQVENRVIASGRTALDAAAKWFRSHGVEAVILGDTLSGEAREVAQVFAALAKEIRHHGGPWQAPVAILSGGETSVTVRSEKGCGGRNAEFQLSLALHLRGLQGVHALAADTDGIDGTQDNAGTIIGPDSLARAKALGIDPWQHLSTNDAYSFFASLDDLLVTGPTLTNVNDYRALLLT